MVSRNGKVADADGGRNPLLPDGYRQRASRSRSRHQPLWRRAMIGHAVSNVVPVVAANRIGNECGQTFYGHSFICDERGDLLAEFGATETGVLTAAIDLALVKRHRAAFGFFRDRRPELYGRLTEDI